jgi:hypothetical protein
VPFFENVTKMKAQCEILPPFIVEFLELSNQFKDDLEFTELMHQETAKYKNKHKNQENEELLEKAIEIYGIYKTNSFPNGVLIKSSRLDTVQDFLCKLQIKLHLHLVTINKHCFIYQVIIRPIKMINRADKLGTFLENKVCTYFLGFP